MATVLLAVTVVGGAAAVVVTVAGCSGVAPICGGASMMSKAWRGGRLDIDGRLPVVSRDAVELGAVATSVGAAPVVMAVQQDVGAGAGKKARRLIGAGPLARMRELTATTPAAVTLTTPAAAWARRGAWRTARHASAAAMPRAMTGTPRM